VPNASGSPHSDSRALLGTMVLMVAGFLIAAGTGGGNTTVAMIGGGLAISTVVYLTFRSSSARSGRLVDGTAHVVSVNDPPTAATHGRCELNLVVQAPRLTATVVRMRDNAVPVTKWPTPGASLPVLVDPKEPRDIRVCWDKVAARQPSSFRQSPVSTVSRPRQTPLSDATPAGTVIDIEPSGGSAPTLVEADDSIDLGYLGPDPESSRLSEADLDSLLADYGSPIREVGVTLVVSNLNRSLAFYRDTLGFFQVESGPNMVLLEARTGRLLLRQRDDAQPRPPRLMHLTLEVSDIETAYRSLSERGVEFLHAPRPVLRGELLELWAVSFSDPDGHGVALTSWRPREDVSSSA